MVKVAKYKAAWHAENNVGFLRLWLENGNARQVKFKSAAEFAVILQILSLDDDVYLTPKGWLTTGSEEPG